ncbi:MAG: MFS transporter, partial [candidate division KSB1 bacterium]|nr:MFS transporter [candidate division KSB1 bacterium]
TALILAFSFLTLGYVALGVFQTKPTTIVALTLIMVGGSFVKPTIMGTVARCSDEANRARAYSIFYQMVNIGAFAGKTVAKPLRTELGLKYINFYSALMALLALVVVIAFYRSPEASSVGKSLREVWQGLVRVLRNVRFICLIVIVAGFWSIQGQLYATIPRYALRMVGEKAAPEWLANINPLVVVLLVVPITHLVRKIRPVSSIAIALLLIPLSALSISLSPILEKMTGTSVSVAGLFALHPVTVMLVVGIALQGLAECFLSPRFYEYASKQAPTGQEGLYMGYSQLTIFFAWLFGFAISGYLLEAFCPDPMTLTPAQRLHAYDHAHYIWYVFVAIGVVAFLCLLLFKYLTDRIDQKQGKELA